MKTLRLSTLVLLFTSIFFACTREELPPTRDANIPTASGGNKATATVIDFTVDPENPVPLSSTIKVSGTLKFDKAVNQFNYRVQMSTTQDANGNWIDFVDTEYGENVNLGVQGTGQNRQPVTANTFPFEFEFPATDLGPGKTGWRLHVTGGDAHNVFLGNETLEIANACVETFTIDGDAEAEDNHDGTYTFTITYKLTSPVDVTGIKFQGGATSGGQFEHDLLEEELVGLEVLHANNQNTVLKWEGNLTACEPVTLSFKYKRKFSCPATDAAVTGDWTAKVGETLLGGPVRVTYSCQ